MCEGVLVGLCAPRDEFWFVPRTLTHLGQGYFGSNYGKHGLVRRGRAASAGHVALATHTAIQRMSMQHMSMQHLGHAHASIYLAPFLWESKESLGNDVRESMGTRMPVI